MKAVQITSPAPRVSRRIRFGAWDVVVYATMLAFALLMIGPFLWVVTTSLKTLEQTAAWPPTWMPMPPTLENYSAALFRWVNFPQLFANTFTIAGAVVVGDVLSGSLVAYGFARYRFPGRNVLFIILLSTMMVPMAVRLVPLFLIFKQMGWISTFYPLILPHWFGTAFYIFLMRQFFMGIPNDLTDAARIDGCSEIGIWWRVVLPLSRPVLAAVAIFSFQYVWNDFMGPLVFLQRGEVKTVMLGIYSLVGMIQEWNFVMAGVVVAMAPMVVLFFVFQNFFVKGITITGLKG
ncbi:MAG: carbohydrate ABC transporter permease [Dehalococcoidales bacterium]|nr:carbohydrate ABC transporter permease [Dehalococcoidales bacterium]